ncbi:MAG: heme NO-binding domain-containing protein [Alkalilacustris sp.]
MHGLVNRALQCFLRDHYGARVWEDVARAAAAPAGGFEAMLRYDDALTLRLLAAAARELDRPEDAVLEDLGAYLVTHPDREGLRRLLRFGGTELAEFLYSLDDLPGRCRLAVPDLDMPHLQLDECGDGRWTLTVRGPWPQFAPVMMGVLRAMADDYGALVLLEMAPPLADGARRISIEVFDPRFTAGRPFDLALGSA